MQPGQPGSRYAPAAERLAAWRAHGVLRPDPRPAYYLSETQFAHAGQTLRRRDLLAALGVEPWSSGAVLPHEHTMAGPKADRLELLRATHLNASPIWVLHRDRPPALEQAWAAAEAQPADRRIHLARRAAPTVARRRSRARSTAIRAAFAHGGPLYIADGHHRYETSLAFRAEAGGERARRGRDAGGGDLGRRPGPARAAHPSSAARARPGAHARGSRDALGRASSTASTTRSGTARPPNRSTRSCSSSPAAVASAPSFGLYGLGQLDLFGMLELRGRKAARWPLPAERSEAWKSLDVSLLHSLLVDPLVAETGRPRDEVLQLHARSTRGDRAPCATGSASVAFFLNPTPVSGVLAVADADDRMPEKSTYFYPKPPAGLVMRDLDAAA